MAVSFLRTTRALDADAGPVVRAALGLAIVLILAWALWFFTGHVGVYEVSRSARIEVATSSRQISAQHGGRLLASGLFIGRVVKAGEILAELDAQPQKLRLAEAEARLASFPERMAALKRQELAASSASAGAGQAAQAAVAAAHARLAGAAAEAAFSRDLAERQRRDSEAGGMAPVDAARALADARKAGAQRDATRQDQRRIAGDAQMAQAERAANAAGLSAQLAQTASEWVAAKVQVAQLQAELEAQRVRAPVDGVIGDVAMVRLGTVLPPGERLATIVPQGDLRIVAMFDAARGIGRLSQGQDARLRLDGFAWTQYGDFSARVRRVAAEPSGQFLRVELLVAPRSGQSLTLRHGMTGTVDVRIEDVSPAIMILRSLGQWLA